MAFWIDFALFSAMSSSAIIPARVRATRGSRSRAAIRTRVSADGVTTIFLPRYKTASRTAYSSVVIPFQLCAAPAALYMNSGSLA